MNLVRSYCRENGISVEEYYTDVLGNEEQYCRYCKKKCRFSSIFRGYRSTCGCSECHKKLVVDTNRELARRKVEDRKRNVVEKKCCFCGCSFEDNPGSNRKYCFDDLCISYAKRPKHFSEPYVELDSSKLDDDSYVNSILKKILDLVVDPKVTLAVFLRSAFRALCVQTGKRMKFSYFKRYIKTEENKSLISTYQHELKFSNGLWYRNNQRLNKKYAPKNLCSFCGAEIRTKKHKWRKYGHYCGRECYMKVFSRVMRMVERDNPDMRSRQSNELKRKIQNGEWIPYQFNSFVREKIVLKPRNGGGEFRFRSSWEIIFHVCNPGLKYEYTRIPYVFDGVMHNYIVDFTDETGRKLYEVKPESKRNDPENLQKFLAAEKWCAENGFEFVLITEKYFNDIDRKFVLATLKKDYILDRKILDRIKGILDAGKVY